MTLVNYLHRQRRSLTSVQTIKPVR